MPIKNQLFCYRNRNGIKYECYGDFLESDADAASKDAIAELRKEGRKAFREKHDGYYRVFVTEK